MAAGPETAPNLHAGTNSETANPPKPSVIPDSATVQQLSNLCKFTTAKRERWTL